jgi:SAM-dependent methyltransferase
MERTRLEQAVERAYSAAASDPSAAHPFPVGTGFASALGYPQDLLAAVPAASAAFTGVSNVAAFAPVDPGGRVLDLGCGAGLDSIAAARRAGPAGIVAGIDFSRPMLKRARAAARQAGTSNVHFVQASACRMPLPDAWASVAIVNGIFNLNPHRAAIFSELARVVRPGGQVCGAELILIAPSRSPQPAGESDWFA